MKTTPIAKRASWRIGGRIGGRIGLGVVLAGLIAAGPFGCASKDDRFVSRSPLVDMKNSKADKRLRVNAVSEARVQAGDDPVTVNATIIAYKGLLWQLNEPVEVRVKIVETMLNDPNPAFTEALRAEGRNLLPLEKSRLMVVKLASAAAERGWTEYTGPLIRSWARAIGLKVTDDLRAESDALKMLHPGKEPARVVLDAFVSPPEPPLNASPDWTTRFRRDAWDLLARLDSSGQMRMGLITSEYGANSSDAAVNALRRCAADLDAIPITGDELTWLTSLLDPNKPENAQWWAEASSAIARVRSNGPFQIRNAEAIRWAAANRPDWMGWSREQLIAELERRLDARTSHSRNSDDGGGRIPDRLKDHAATIKWGDLLTILVVDDVMATPGMIDTLATQAALDQSDETTEYGGVIAFSDQLKTRRVATSGGPVAVLFPPRPRERQGDMKFVASADMVAASDRSLLHYHFHVQRDRNVEYAGPSSGDLTYAARSGRNCLVMTSISAGLFNLDYYQPDGKVIDLGTVRVE
jgi:hypothetical protein